jgi:metacaspase-1
MKKAVLVGINDYPGTFNDLMGCVNDVHNMQDLLTSLFGFKTGHICILTDRDATSLNILKALQELVTGAKAGDHLVFHYSGHGSQVPDTSGDEKDRLDEILCPYDLDWRTNVIRDDDLNRIFEPVAPGVHVEIFLDSCHSGTGLRTLEGAYRKQRFMPAPVEIMTICAATIKSVRPLKPTKIQVLWAACRSSQYAADALLNGKYCGAFTTFLCDLVRASKGVIPQKDLLNALRKTLKENRFTQVPQLETGRKLKKAALFGG